MRYVILTDIHANALALEAVMDEVEALLAAGEPLEVWFLGDLLGYGPDPIECLQWLWQQPPDLPKRWVPGNHDEWFTYQQADGLSDDAVDSLRRHAEQMALPEHAALSDWFYTELRAALADPARSLLQQSFAHGRVALGVHAAVSPVVRRTLYLKPWEPYLLRAEFPRLRAEVGEAAAAVMFCGHNHYPMWAEAQDDGEVGLRSIRYYEPLPLRTDGLTIVNPGSVGQPRDGDPRAAYALFDARAWTIEFRRVKYSWETAAALLKARNYRPSLAERLVDAQHDHTSHYLSVYQRPQWDLRAEGDEWTE